MNLAQRLSGDPDNDCATQRDLAVSLGAVSAPERATGVP